ncbi:hypothetical protein F4678DRAFT_485693 [Xylaria arbuscula]|nr:hypothetical protein F4678DRAFT_485693 [Xylaria arbuscula]
MSNATYPEDPEIASEPRPSSPREQSKPPFTSRLPLKESIDRTELAIILGGLIILFACIAFLSFLWFGYGSELEAAAATRIWRKVALENWTTRSITITALVLRSVVSLQVALCTSMTAALILEKRVARKSDVAYLSIVRSVNDGPRKVIQLLASYGISYFEFWLISLLALVMLALQFSSTLLLSDLHNFVIVGNVETQMVGVAGSFPLPPSTVFSVQPALLSGPIYPVFGEENSNSNITPATSGFSDTGTIKRGYLPFQGSENRTSVRRYRHIVGTVDYGQSLRQAYKGIDHLCVDPECESAPFDCSVPGTVYSTSDQSNYCFLDTVGRTSKSIYALNVTELYKVINMEGEPWSINSTMFLVFRSNVNASYWNAIVNPLPVPPATVADEWNRFQMVDGGSVDVSLCFARFFIEHQYVSMVARKPTHEPDVLWDGVSLKHNTTAVATYIGLGGPLETPTDRGLMDMDILKNPNINTPNVEPQWGLDAITLTAALLERAVTGEVTDDLIQISISGCVFCSDYSFRISPEYSLLFTDIIQSSGRAALAIHSITALVAASAYDTLLKGFNIIEAVELSTTTSVRTPGPCSEHQCYGFISVIVLLGVHILLSAIIIILYVCQVRYSRLSNTWHAVSQLMCEELKDVLVQGNNAKDKSITKMLKSDGTNDFVRLGLADGGNQVEVIKYTEEHQTPNKQKKSHG